MLSCGDALLVFFYPLKLDLLTSTYSLFYFHCRRGNRKSAEKGEEEELGIHFHKFMFGKAMQVRVKGLVR